jgi:hypothetical protein
MRCGARSRRDMDDSSQVKTAIPPPASQLEVNSNQSGVHVASPSRDRSPHRHHILQFPTQQHSAKSSQSLRSQTARKLSLQASKIGGRFIYHILPSLPNPETRDPRTHTHKSLHNESPSRLHHKIVVCSTCDCLVLCIQRERAEPL